MNQKSRTEVLILYFSHEIYSGVHKIIWIISSMLLLGGLLQFGGGMYARWSNAPINTTVNYGKAMSGSPVGPRDYDSDQHGQSIGGIGGICWGLVGLTGGFILRRKSRTYLALPEAEKEYVEAFKAGKVSNSSEFGTVNGKNAISRGTDEFTKLHTLLKAGAITETEYTTAKEKVIRTME